MADLRRSLSDLPDDAIDEILCQLPIKDAARTSVLSRFWRRRWHSIPDLIFEDVRPPLVVDQVLRLHSGSIRRFGFYSLPSKMPSAAAVVVAVDAEPWLTALSLHSSSTLRFIFLDHSSVTPDCIARRFPNLTHLGLSFCQSVQIQSGSFLFLKVLSLQITCPSVVGGDEVSKLISSCPSLEKLTVVSSPPPGYDHHPAAASLDIVAPNLKYLCLFRFKLFRFAIKSAPLLETLDLHNCYFDGFTRYDMMSLFVGIMASVKNLKLPCYLLLMLGRGHVPHKLPLSLDNLSSIHLRTCFHDERASILGTLCLLRTIPNLRKLTISTFATCRCGQVNDAQQVEEEIVNLLVSTKLERVEFYIFRQTEYLMAFIKLMLATAQLLETMTVCFSEIVTESIKAQVLEYPRASNKAQILLKNIDE